MNFSKQNTSTQKRTSTQNLSQTSSRQPLSNRDVQEILQLLSHTDDSNLIVNIFSTLNIVLLKKNIPYALIIKRSELYQKLAIVLKNGSQSKILTALNLLSALLYCNEEELTKVKSLQIFTKNMIRISGCLTIMTELFTSFMMQQETWMALCRCISETCDSSLPNQTYCSHLVPLCIQRCKRGNMNPLVSVLQSLLSNHQGNIKLFYENNGISIFDRECLLNPACLQLLNLLVENNPPEHREEILKAAVIFRTLRSYLNKYGRKSMIGQWAYIILFSYDKVIQTDIVIGEGDEQIFKFKKDHNSTIFPDYINRTVGNETEELLRNVLREAHGWQNQFGSEKFRDNILSWNYKKHLQEESVEMPYSYAKIDKPKVNENPYYKDKNFSKFVMANETFDHLSFLFSSKGHHSEQSFRKLNNAVMIDQRDAEEVETNRNEPIQSFINKSFEGSINNKNYFTHFNPLFTSTPVSRKLTNLEATSKRKSLIRTRTKAHIISNKTINNRSKFTNTTLRNKNLSNKSMSVRFLDVINGSCATLVKGFKRMFTTKKVFDKFDETSKDRVTHNEVKNKSYDSTGYLRKSVSDSEDQKSQIWTNFTKEISLGTSSCNTCNNTFDLQHKLKKDASLQQAVKKLKLGINLYGCDFKKISRNMWPREKYMTQKVLYNLYRKLIIKQ